MASNEGVQGHERRTKAGWRAELRTHPVTPTAPEQASVRHHLATFLAGENGIVLFYRAMEREIALEPLADELGWHRFVTTRTPDDGPLTIHPAIGASERHRFGFAQPVEGAMELPPHHVSVALVPGLAFDRRVARLGHGTGYYDELLERLPADRPRIGITLDALVFDRLPTEPHDIAMTHLATESGVIEIDP